MLFTARVKTSLLKVVPELSEANSFKGSLRTNVEYEEVCDVMEARAVPDLSKMPSFEEVGSEVGAQEKEIKVLLEAGLSVRSAVD